MVDFALLRKNMVESQVRTSDVTDRRLLRAMAEVPREAFVPEALRPLAYSGEALALAPGLLARALPAPMTMGKLIQLANIEPTDKVLEIGCATGYGTALMARLAASVTALDSDPALTAAAKANIAGLGLTNDDIETGPLEAGWPAGAPYDLIVVSGAVPELSPAWREQLRDGGRLVAVIADGPIARAMLFEKTGKEWGRRFGFDTVAPALPGFARKPAFAL